MLSIERTHAAVIACYASPQALDSLPSIPGAHACRVAPDELLLIAPPARRADTERRAAEHFTIMDATALVFDQSDGWTGFTLRGDEALTVFSQLSAIPLPTTRPAFVQGAMAGGAAKILLLNQVVHVLVPLTLRQHVAARLHDVCANRAIVPDTEIAFTSDPPTPIEPSRHDAVAARRLA